MGEQGREELRRQDCVRRGGGEQACGRVRRAGARGRAVNAGEEGEDCGGAGLRRDYKGAG
ncbi:hypothetical protein DEO72_LG9g1985 [Vigna unguiculata]|uniref:Uncharacterized protein n=1 Tax=Vigna unguiculata TaxID=3917 RepID=A0A4D6MZH1_VIGUN|nr:hypothetical protein DEO72_LG9g1985 [Vigna unguiculata]